MRLRVFAPVVVCTIAFVLCGATFAQTTAPPATTDAMPLQAEQATLPAGVVDLDAIVVSGRYAGPGLWKVRNGERMLWILGTQNPLPKRMEWDSANVERRIGESQELLMPPTVDVDADVGFFRGLTLLPSLFKARKNPDEKLLRDVVPAEQYARWLTLKQRYIGSVRGIEEWRPVFAALELYDKAITRSGMTQESLIANAVSKAAKRAKVKITTPTVKIKIANAKATLREFSNEALNDQDCFKRTLDRIETDLDTMVGRANAWAEGDVETLRNLPYRNQFTACGEALTSNGIARKQGMQDIQARIENEWLAAADKALRENTTTFAVLPMSQLLQPDGLLQRLLANGYVVEEP
jgi:TraB/PrgY/gumN family